MALSEKKKISNARWDAANLKRLSLAMLVTDYNRMEAYLQKTGITRNRFINNAISEKIDREQDDASKRP